MEELYDITHGVVKHEEILRGKELKINGAAEFAWIKAQVDRLLTYTDVQLENKEPLLQFILKSITKLANSRGLFGGKISWWFGKIWFNRRKDKTCYINKDRYW